MMAWFGAGRPIAEEQFEAVFYLDRSDKLSSSLASGLGLSIVDD